VPYFLQQSKSVEFGMMIKTSGAKGGIDVGIPDY
jgi:hypothetical protein